MTSNNYHFERCTVLTAVFCVAGILGILFWLMYPATSTLTTAGIFLGAGVLGGAYVLKKRLNNRNFSPKLDERDEIVNFKAAGATYEVSLVLTLFCSMNAGTLLGLLAGTPVSETITSAAQNLLMLIFLILLIAYLGFYSYFDRYV